MTLKMPRTPRLGPLRFISSKTAEQFRCTHASWTSTRKRRAFSALCVPLTFACRYDGCSSRISSYDILESLVQVGGVSGGPDCAGTELYHGFGQARAASVNAR